MCMHACAGDTAAHTYVHMQPALGRAAQLQWLCLHLSHRPIGADVFSKRAGTEPCMATAHVLQGTLSGLVQPGPIKLRHPWPCSVSSQSASSRWILPKRKTAGAFWPWFWMQAKAQLVGVIWRHRQQHSLDPEKVTSTRAMLETSRYLPELIFKCVRNQMDDINAFCWSDMLGAYMPFWIFSSTCGISAGNVSHWMYTEKEVLKALKGLDIFPKLLGFVWLNEFLGIYALNWPPKSVNPKYEEGLT